MEQHDGFWIALNIVRWSLWTCVAIIAFAIAT